MKKLIYLLAGVLVLTAVGCGDDEPVIPRDRDIQFSTFELFHIDGTTPTASLEQCDVTIHRKTEKADLNLKVAVGGNVHSLALTDVALTYDSDKNIYNARTTTTSNSRVTNLVLAIDSNDYFATMSFLLDGTTQVIGTSSDLLYRMTSHMTFSDLTTYTANNGKCLVSVHPDGQSANITLGDLLHEKDVMNYVNIALEGLPMNVTATGYHIATDQLVTEKGQYSRFDYSTGSPTTQFGDSLFLRFDNLKADLNVLNNTMTGSWTMVRLKRVTDTIQKTPEVKTQQRVVEVNRTDMTVTGNIY